MQTVGFDFFFAGEPDESVEAVEVEAFEVGTLDLFCLAKDVISDFGCCPFWIACTMTAFDDWEEGHNFRGSSVLTKRSSSSFGLLIISSCLPFLEQGANKRSFKIENHPNQFLDFLGHPKTAQVS